MPRIEPHLIPVVSDLARGLRDLNMPFAIIGALVPELLLGARPVRMTNDVDATVVVQSAEDFERLKEHLAPLRIPVHREHPFRFKVNTDSADAERRFRSS